MSGFPKLLKLKVGEVLAKGNPKQPPECGPVIEIAEVGGLHHRYERRAA